MWLQHYVHFDASAFVMAPRSAGSSGVTALGKKATMWPSLPMTYLLKFQAVRWPEAPRNL